MDFSLTQSDDSMICIVCQAMQYAQLCSKCLSAKVASVRDASCNGGHWTPITGTHATQILRACNDDDMCFVDLETQSVCHAYKRKLIEVSKLDAYNVAECARQFKEFASKHAGKHSMWYDSRQLVLRRITPQRLYDKQSILARLRRNPSAGLCMTEIAKEYDGANDDVYSLIQEGTVLQHHHTIWLRPMQSTCQ